ncbi:NAD(P)H-dependent flavin oxidoreductase [Mycobacterium triplex]|nr:nitronate monooxygenase [Mycobacterium triplex]
MLTVSGPELVAAACNAGLIGAFPTANAKSVAHLDEWLSAVERRTESGPSAPWAANLIMRSPRLQGDIEVLVRHRAPIVITSVGSPAPVIAELHAAGTVVLADVATVEHAHRAVAAGADGLVLLSAGAGGQTGHANALAFPRAIREFFDGPMVLAGGVCDGYALRAAVVLGCDLGYIGTPFIATNESMASPAYKQMLVDCSLDDVVLTRAFTGLPTNMLTPSIVAAGLDPTQLDNLVSPAEAKELYGGPGAQPRRWADLHSAGHSVSAVHAVRSVAELVSELEREYRAALNLR